MLSQSILFSLSHRSPFKPSVLSWCRAFSPSCSRLAHLLSASLSVCVSVSAPVSTLLPGSFSLRRGGGERGLRTGCSPQGSAWRGGMETSAGWLLSPPVPVSRPFQAELLPLILFHLGGRSPEVEFQCPTPGPAPSACAHQPSAPFYHFPFTLWGVSKTSTLTRRFLGFGYRFQRSLGSPKEQGWAGLDWVTTAPLREALEWGAALGEEEGPAVGALQVRPSGTHPLVAVGGSRPSKLPLWLAPSAAAPGSADEVKAQQCPRRSGHKVPVNPQEDKCYSLSATFYLYRSGKVLCL